MESRPLCTDPGTRDWDPDLRVSADVDSLALVDFLDKEAVLGMATSPVFLSFGVIFVDCVGGKCLCGGLYQGVCENVCRRLCRLPQFLTR